MKIKLPMAAVTAVCCIALIESFFFYTAEPLTGIPYFQPTADDAMVVAKVSYLNERYLTKNSESSNENEIAIFGDSSALHGLHPATLSASGNYSYINFGTLASLTVVGYSEMAIAAMNSKKYPTAVVLAVLPQTLAIKEKKAREMGQVGRFLIAYHFFDQNAYSIDVADYKNWLIKKHRFNVFPEEFGGSFKRLDEDLRRENGFYAEKQGFLKKSNRIEGFVPSKMSIDALDRAQAISKEKSIPLLFIFNPKPRSLVNVEKYESDTADFLFLLASKGYLTVQKKAPLFENSYFATETHLTKEAAFEYSSEMSFLIEDKL